MFILVRFVPLGPYDRVELHHDLTRVPKGVSMVHNCMDDPLSSRSSSLMLDRSSKSRNEQNTNRRNGMWLNSTIDDRIGHTYAKQYM